MKPTPNDEHFLLPEQPEDKTHPVAMFYTSLAFITCADYYFKFVLEWDETHYKIKGFIKWIMNKHKELFKHLEKGLPRQDAATWKGNWTKREFESFASIYELLSMMTDEQRLVLEELANSIITGDIQAEEDFKAVEKVTLEPESNYLVLIKSPTTGALHVVDAVYHGEKLGFYAAMLTSYILPSTIRGVRKSNLDSFKYLA